MKSRNALVGVEVFKKRLIVQPAVRRDVFNQIRQLRALSNPSLNVYRDKIPTSPRGNLCQPFTTLIVRSCSIAVLLKISFTAYKY